MALQPLPAPGLAAFPHFLTNSTSPQIIVMKGESFSSDWTVTDGSGQPFLQIRSEKMSMSHRKHLVDAKSGQEICEIRKESFSSSYSGAAPNGTALFNTESHFHFSGSETIISFTNNAAGGQRDMLTYKKQSFSSGGDITHNGKVVATIDKKSMSMRGQYDLQIAPGLDPFLVVALVVTLDDREKTKRGGAAAGASAGASAGGGC